MIYVIAGGSHTGKTLLAQHLMEKLSIPYLSIDHIKMGLIRSGMIQTKVEDDEALTIVLWPIIKEIIKTVIENRQEIIIEGCYIPYTWKQDFESEECLDIQYICLIFDKQYLIANGQKLYQYENVIEQRISSEPIQITTLIKEHQSMLALCKRYDLPYLIIKDDYECTIQAWLNKQSNNK